MEDNQKYALITGASSDIGWQFAEALAKYGYSEVAASNQLAQENSAQQGTFKTEFTTDQANMEGNTTSTFTYQANLKNTTAEQQVYSFMASTLRGWSVSFKYNSRQDLFSPHVLVRPGYIHTLITCCR